MFLQVQVSGLGPYIPLHQVGMFFDILVTESRINTLNEHETFSLQFLW